MTGRDQTHRRIDAVWRTESAKIIAALTRIVRDVGLAEELVQDALVAALEQWPGEGLPDNPAAWLMATAKHRAIDRLRHLRLQHEKHPLIGAELDLQHQLEAADRAAALDEFIQDDLLRLIFIACHPLLGTEARLALTLRLLGGLSTDEIARAFLVPESTVAQRIVRAKKTLSEAQVPFELPPPAELAERLASVLEVIYLIFNEGYAATSGEDWLRPALAEEALRLGRVLARLAPLEPEVHALVALMEIQASRNAARVGADGAPVLLAEQDRSRWDWPAVRRGLAALERAEALGGRAGRYGLQAAIAACHGRALRPEDTDWERIAALYAELAARAPSPVVELNRAVAVAMAEGPEAGLRITDRLRREPALKDYHLLPSVRGDLLFRLGRRTEARAEFERAAGLARNLREQQLLRQRVADCAGIAP